MNTENKMGTQKMLPLIVNMTWPPLCSMMMAYSYNFVDSMFVSWAGRDALEAVSLAFPLNTFLLACAIGFGVGINVLVAKHLGEQDQESADRAATTALWASTVIAVIINIVVLLLLGPYFSLFTDDPVLTGLCMDYGVIITFMVLPTMHQVTIQKILQGTGNMIAPMLLQMLGVFFNFFLDPAMIFGWGPFPVLGIKGAAISTVFGYSLSALLSFYVLMGRKQKVEIHLLRYGCSFALTMKIIRIGMPSFLMNMLGAVMVTVSNMVLIGFSTAAVAFFGAYFKMQQIIERCVNSLVQGVLPVMSYNYGAKKYDRLKSAFHIGNIIAVIFMGSGALVLLFFPAELLAIFKADEAMTMIGIPGMRIMAAGYIFAGMSIIFASYMQATANIKQSIIINLLRQAVLLFPMMYGFAKLMGITGVWAAFPLAEILTLLYSVIVYKRGRNHPDALTAAEGTCQVPKTNRQ
ncbi:MAG: MATE family efflux transporter [Clostridia bacterium]|nr:MATE family efflux transporter [Clostridia bacterium]